MRIDSYRYANVMFVFFFIRVNARLWNVYVYFELEYCKTSEKGLYTFFAGFTVFDEFQNIIKYNIMYLHIFQVQLIKIFLKIIEVLDSKVCRSYGLYLMLIIGFVPNVLDIAFKSDSSVGILFETVTSKPFE